MGFIWQGWALEALLRTGIHEYEVMQVLASGRRRPRRAIDDDSGVTVLAVQGRTGAGRALLVALKQTSKWDAVIIGARDLTPEELAEFEEWEAGQ